MEFTLCVGEDVEAPFDVAALPAVEPPFDVDVPSLLDGFVAFCFPSEFCAAICSFFFSCMSLRKPHKIVG